MSDIFKWQYPGETLDDFVQRKVAPTKWEKENFSAEITAVVSCLQNQTFSQPYSVKKVVKSGSLGKGTAIRRASDIDLVVFFNGMENINDLIDDRKQLLYELKGALKRSLRVKPMKTNKYVDYCLSYTCNGLHVDILPAFDILSEYRSPSQVYRVMREYSLGQAAQQFSASLAPLQLQFVKHIPEYIKRVIRLLKVWKKENHLDIRSYSLELLTIFIWRTKREDNPGTDYLFREVMGQLATCGTLCVSFNDNYNSSKYTWFMYPPYIRDPANPYMNTLLGASIGNISECAKTTLRKLKGMSVDTFCPTAGLQPPQSWFNINGLGSVVSWSTPTSGVVTTVYW